MEKITLPITPSMQERTTATIRRIAELKIAAYGLSCTVDEYIARTQSKASPMPTIRKGQTVVIAPQWRDTPDDDTVYLVLSDPEHGRTDISPVDWPYPIRPIQTVTVDMITPC